MIDGDNYDEYEEFVRYRENRKGRLVFSIDFYPSSDPRRIGDHFGNHSQLTSDEIINLYDMGYRWAIEDLKEKISELLNSDMPIGGQLERIIQTTFYNGEKGHTSTDLSKLRKRKEVFNELRRYNTLFKVR